MKAILEILNELKENGSLRFQKPAGAGQNLIYELTWNGRHYHYKQFVKTAFTSIELDMNEADCLRIIQAIRNLGQKPE